MVESPNFFCPNWKGGEMASKGWLGEKLGFQELVLAANCINLKGFPKS
jgi:hypothetical protein